MEQMSIDFSAPRGPQSALGIITEQLLGNYPAAESTFVDDAIREFTGSLEGGADCPCCGRFGKLYARKIYSTMALWLTWLATTWECNRPPSGWFHVKQGPAFKNRKGGDDTKLAHWNLIEPKYHEGDTTKRCAGLWRPTKLGQSFVYRRVRIPKRVLLYDAKVFGFSAEMVGIEDVMGEDYDYQEVIRFTDSRQFGAVYERAQMAREDRRNKT